MKDTLTAVLATLGTLFSCVPAALPQDPTRASEQVGTETIAQFPDAYNRKQGAQGSILAALRSGEQSRARSIVGELVSPTASLSVPPKLLRANVYLRECDFLYEKEDPEGAATVAAFAIAELKEGYTFSDERSEVQYHKSRARLYERFLHDEAEAEACYDRILEIDPLNRYALAKKAALEERRKRHIEWALEVEELRQRQEDLMRRPGLSAQ